MARLRPVQSPSDRETDAPAPASGDRDAEGAELNLRIVAGLARYLREQHGDEVLAAVAAAGGRKPEELDGRHLWVSHDDFERMLAAARKVIPDETAFRDACAYKIEEGYGPMVLFFWALSPGAVYEQAARAYPMITTISETMVERQGRTAVRFVYRSTKAESRSMCLSRQGQAVTLPQLWGLPRAQLTETRCIAWGDDACEYHIRWMDHRRWLPVLLGGVVGGALWLGLAFAVGLGGWGWVYPVFGLLLGYVLELRRVNRSNQRYAEEHREALQEYAAGTAETQRELVALQQREKAWSQLVEEQLAERTARLRAMAKHLEQLDEKRLVALRGLSHDIRNPLAALRLNQELLEEERERLSAQLGRVLDDQRDMLLRLQGLLEELLLTASAEVEVVRLEVQPLDTAPLADVLRRRLQAFCHQRDIRVSVFRTREAPAQIHTDPFLLDRVMDNLLTNAAKYTERGSIVVEITGTPGFLTVKISDTGRGIPPEQIERIFAPGGSRPEDRAPASFGVGLATVVQLLHQLGARLEVMSKVDLGTTFWVHFPVARPDTHPSEPPAEESGLFAKVVRIREASG